MDVDHEEDCFQKAQPETGIHPLNCEASRTLKREIIQRISNQRAESKNDLHQLKTELKNDQQRLKNDQQRWNIAFGSILIVVIGSFLALWLTNSSFKSTLFKEQEKWQRNFFDEIKDTMMHLEESITSSNCAAIQYKTVSNVDPPTFNMTRFSDHKRDSDRWTSNPVYTNQQGYKICLRVIANGNGFGKGTHVSVFLHFMRGEFDDHLKWPFRGIISLRLLDQHRQNHKNGSVMYDDNVVESVCTRVRDGEVGKGEWGYIKFIPHTELEPYLHEDTLVFQIYKVELH